jgi:hypothetical protein
MTRWNSTATDSLTGMMKKYWGKKEWSESLYLADIFDEDSYDKKTGKLDETKKKTEFVMGFPFDWLHVYGFDDTNRFEDTNDFITYSETFNIYQDGKI